MSPIIDLQRRLAPAGRIRIGEQVATGTAGKKRPAKLSAFRLTSSNRRAIEAVARLYGGDPHPWQDAPTEGQWEVYTTATEIPVVIPPERMAYSQWYEEWSAGGCLHRCDGQTDTINDAACACDPDKRACKITTRLALMLAQFPGIGLWTLATSGFYAATELGGSFDIVQMLSQSLKREVLPGMLRLEERVIKRGGKTHKFAVPILDLSVDMAAVAAGNAAQLAGVPVPATVALSQPSPAPAPALTPVPTDDSPLPSLPEQLAAVEAPKAKPPRANAAPPVPATGRRPRSAAQAAAGDAAQIDEGSGSDEASNPPEHVAEDTAPDAPASSPAPRRTRSAVAPKPPPRRPDQENDKPVPGWCRDLLIRATNLNLDDDQFDAVVLFVTNDRTSSTKELTAREASYTNDTLTEIETGGLVLDESESGWSVNAKF